MPSDGLVDRTKELDRELAVHEDDGRSLQIIVECHIPAARSRVSAARR